ncbi:MAG: fumarate hydratase [Candidatus Cloacimonadota bacterium]|nr:MAG: fumarate hydratase [Candidatus Cloacimonadota bacterium]
MRIINTEKISEETEKLFKEIAFVADKELIKLQKKAFREETSPLAKDIISILLDNCEKAEKTEKPICQDTGTAFVFLEIGQEVHLTGENLSVAVNKAAERAYKKNYLRKSIVKDPLLDRENTQTNTPAIIYTEIVPGDKLKITVAAKGGGAENMSQLKMFTPATPAEKIEEWIADCAIKAGGNACPPMIVGAGLGGSFDYAAFLAKKALLRDLSETNPHKGYAEMEERILNLINKSNVGAQGLGGKITALKVMIETFPCHIASLPAAVNIQCHAHRHKSIII